MELTKEQIQVVEKYLETKNFDFIDLKVEVLDHILSDIENQICENSDFENAFKMTILKWEQYFKETSSFYFGLYYSESKIVVKKATKIFKPFYFVYLAIYFFPMILFKLIAINLNKNTADFINAFLISASFIALVYGIVIIVKTIQSKVKSTYSFILRTQYLGIIFLVFGIILGVFDQKAEVSAVFLSFVLGGFSVVFILHFFYKKHKEIIKKHQI